MILLYPNNELFALKIDLDAVKPLFLDATVQTRRDQERPGEIRRDQERPRRDQEGAGETRREQETPQQT